MLETFSLLLIYLWMSAMALAHSHPRSRSYSRSSTDSLSWSKSHHGTPHHAPHHLGLSSAVGQMSQLDLAALMDNVKMKLDPKKIRKFARKGISSYFNAPINWNVSEWRKVVAKIQHAHARAGTLPPIIALDSIHGANYVKGAVIFPQPINIAATFKPSYAHDMGYVTGRDTLAAGVSWTFAPILDLGVRTSWSRHYETFGEDPLLVTHMGKAMIEGIQSIPHMVACAKHFLAYSSTLTSIDRDPVFLNRYQLFNYFLKPYIGAMEAGVKTFMTAYSALEGVPAVANPFVTKTLLRKTLGFKGVIVTDYEEIYNLFNNHKIASSRAEAVALSMKRTDIDMSMIPSDTEFIDILKTLVKKGYVSLKRLQKSVKRILHLKKELNLFHQPMPGEEYVSEVGNKKDQDLALKMATESIVLLQNKRSALPLSSSTSVFLTGHLIDNVGKLCGGWTLKWQGSIANYQFPGGFRSLLGAMRDLKPASLVAYSEDLDDVSALFNIKKKWHEVVRNVCRNDVTVILAGEHPYAERPGDLPDPALPKDQMKFIRRIASIPCRSKIVLVLVEGRPRLLGDIPDLVDAVVFAGLPGQFGAEAITRVLYGDHVPNGKLPFTYPREYADQNLPYYRYFISMGPVWLPLAPRWPFGHGLSYTTFTYTNLQVNKNTSSIHNINFEVIVNVNNTGSYNATETVLLFVQQKYRKVHIPELKMLKHYKEAKLNTGMDENVKFILAKSDFEYFLPKLDRKERLKKHVDHGEYVISIGAATDCNILPNDLCKTIRLTA